jgi:hypothetical protein
MAMCSLGVFAFLTIIPLGEISGQTFLTEALTQENLDAGDLADL